MRTDGKGPASTAILPTLVKCPGGGECRDGIIRTEITPGLGSRQSRRGHAGNPADRWGPGQSLLWEVETSVGKRLSVHFPVFLPERLVFLNIPSFRAAGRSVCAHPGTRMTRRTDSSC